MNQEIFDLLEKAKKALHYQSTGFDYIDQALSILKQQPTAGETKCKTCGDTKEVLCDECGGACAFPASASGTRAIICHKCNLHGYIPCPDCQQSTAGDFTKTFWKFLNEPQSDVIQWEDMSYEACDRLDTSEARIKDLLEACLNSPAHNYFADFAELAEECMVKPSMAVYRNRFSGLATFLRSGADRAKKIEAAISKAKKLVTK